MVPGLGPRVFGFPNTILTTLRYCDFFVMTSGAGVISTQVFAANGLFDPDITGTGHQPMYRDTYAGIYNNYVVIGSKITVTATVMEGDSTSIFILAGDDDSTPPSGILTRMEANNSSYTTLGMPSGGASQKTLYGTFAPLRDFGTAVEDDGASAVNVGANPSQLWCYQVSLRPGDGTYSGTMKWLISFDIEYTVKFMELVSPSIS